MKTVVVLALLVIQLALPLALGRKSIGYDGEQYLRYARNIIELGQYTYDGSTPSCGRAPGYPLFLAAFLALFNSTDLIYPAQLLLLFGAYAMTAGAARYYLHGWWAIGLLSALVPLYPLNCLALRLMSESLFIFLIAGALYFLHEFLRRRKSRYFLLFVTLMTLSAYVRPVSLFFVPFAVAVLVLRHRIKWRHALVSLTLMLVMVAPWTYRNWVLFNKLIPVAATYGSVYYMTDQTEFDVIVYQSAGASHEMPAYQRNVGDRFELDPEANDRFLREARLNIAADPLGFVKRCIIKTLFVWTYLPGTKNYLTTSPGLFYAGMVLQICFLITAAGGWVWLLRKRAALAWPAAMFTVYHVFILFPLYAESRYLIPVYLVLCPYAACGLLRLYDVMRQHNRTQQAILP